MTRHTDRKIDRHLQLDYNNKGLLYLNISSSATFKLNSYQSDVFLKNENDVYVNIYANYQPTVIDVIINIEQQEGNGLLLLMLPFQNRVAIIYRIISIFDGGGEFIFFA